MRTILIAIALCATPSAFAQTPIIPITPGQDLSSLGAYWGGVGSPDCTSRRADASAERAIEVCTQIINSNVDRTRIARAYLTRGDRYEDSDQADRANADFARSAALYTEEIEEAPLTPQGYVGRSWAQQRLNRLDEALADATRAIEVDDGYAAGYVMRAYTHFRMRNYHAAAADFDRTAQIARRMASHGSARAPGGSQAYVHPQVHAGRCEARAAAGVELNIAETACRAAMRAAPEMVFSRGFLKFKQGRYEEAWADFDAAVREDDTNGYYFYGRGVAAIRLGRQAEGEADITRGRDIEGEEDIARYADAGLVP